MVRRQIHQNVLVKDLICLFGSLDVTQNADNLIVCVFAFPLLPSVHIAKANKVGTMECFLVQGPAGLGGPEGPAGPKGLAVSEHNFI